jgi:arylsulfatase A-like enzyme
VYLRIFAIAFTGLLSGSSSATGQDSLRNVLFIAIDDLNHWVGHLNRNAQTKTPNIDRLAASGVSFSSAYCPAPACNPSRIALMSGLRPHTTGCYDNQHDWRPYISTDKLLNSLLLEQGYSVFGTGKIFHGNYGNTEKWTQFRKGKEKEVQRHASAQDHGVGAIKFYPLEAEDSQMPDYRTVDFGISHLEKIQDRPFFLAVGLVKPHMPFAVPKKWFDMFPLDSIELPPHVDDDLSDLPTAGVKMARPEGDHAQLIKSGRWKEAVQAYLASIAFCDSQVGRLLEALDRSPHSQNTIVCLWSDHGWSLGEKEHWRKFALWEEPTRSVFIWRVPGVTPTNQQCNHPVDLMSIYPTLCSLLKVPKPDHVQGADITPLLRHPDHEKWDTPALTTHGRGNHAIRHGKWRLIQYADGSQELYDHENDPLEWSNLAGKSDFSAKKSKLTYMLPRGNAPTLPQVKQ